MQDKGKRFTIVELMVALAIFSIIMLVMMGVFDQSQRALRGSNSLTTVYENARVVFQTIEQDFLNAMASSDQGQEIPFSITKDGLPCMVVLADIPDAKSRFIEVSYKLDTATIDGSESKDFDGVPIKYFKRGYTTEKGSNWDFWGVKGARHASSTPSTDLRWTNGINHYAVVPGVIDIKFQFRTYRADERRYSDSINFEKVKMEYYVMGNGQTYNYLPMVVDVELTLYDPLSESEKNCPKSKRTFFKRMYFSHGTKSY